jgi:tRNA pseudouridine55 synthase
MASRRGATGLCGVLAVDKPLGLTSHDVVAAVRRATGEGRVGHAGTLDPLATGLLVVLIGPYTRLEPYLSAETKTYEAQVTFGAETDTDDAEGAVTREAAVPAELFDPSRAQAILDGFLGDSLQTPPAYSAIKVGGKTAHRVARAGGTIVLEPRPVHVATAELRSADADMLTWRVGFAVSKGTYIRSLARDIGRAAGTAAHLGGLRRTASGQLRLAVAHALDEVADAAAAGDLPRLFADPVAALGLPVVEAAAAEVRLGRPLASGALTAEAGKPVAVTAGGRLAAVYRAERDALVPEAVFPEGCR